jgi:hypothetical protein
LRFGKSAGEMQEGEGTVGPKTPARRNGRMPSAPAKATLEPDKSQALRDQLLSELEALTTSDSATAWAHRILSAKNSLTATDARCVEEAFQSKLPSLGDGDADMIDLATPVADSTRSPLPKRPSAEQKGEGPPSTGIDKSTLTLPEPRRLRDKEHVRFVAREPCLICGRQPADAHHLRFAQLRAIARKVSDEFTVPLCRGHHREVHRHGDEAAWWKKSGIDPTARARALWLKTHPLPTPVNANQSQAKRNRLISRRGSNYKTKPIVAAGPQ